MAGGLEDPGIPRRPHLDLTVDEAREQFPELFGMGGGSRPPPAPQRGRGKGSGSKMGNKITEVDGVNFHSKKEADRWLVLRELEKRGRVRDLKRQVRFPLDVNGYIVTTYIADFTYIEVGQGEQYVVEDTKGFRTDLYKLKAKLFEAVKGFKIRET
jgi:hypothetical protein